ncbi:YcdB/YcdC domain-containing protein [Brevibacillus dissolubilis]|uniref:YcdB/YcdC domain-containing protein n=1 Tax=Brevibacillus dissolubilis TaxID=1844116 RepID=UPI001115D89D|nr:YcdB/YcdC domain-containing protein [Brevibacillus dissolubilis]
MKCFNQVAAVLLTTSMLSSATPASAHNHTDSTSPHSPKSNENEGTPITPTSAIQTAELFLQKHLGPQAKHYRLLVQDRMTVPEIVTGDADKLTANSPLTYAYPIRFERLINGIPLDHSTITVWVGQTGEILRYEDHSQIHDPSAFPIPSRAITMTEAKKAFTKHLELYPYYRKQQLFTSIQSGERPKTAPVLKYEVETAVINALTGEKIWLEPASRHTQYPDTIVPLKKTGTDLLIYSQADAAALIQQQFGIHPDQMQHSVQLGIHPASGLPEDTYQWVDEPTGRTITMTIDHARRHITSLILPEPLATHTPGKRITSEAAQRAAISYLEGFLNTNETMKITQVFLSSRDSLIPGWVDQGKLAMESPIRFDGDQYVIVFSRLHDGIPVQDDSFGVSVDAATGAFRSYYAFSPAATDSLPAVPAKLSVDQARKAYLDQLSLELRYVWPRFHGQFAPQPYLVYVPKNKFSFIDATTGKMI